MLYRLVRPSKGIVAKKWIFFEKNKNEKREPICSLNRFDKEVN